ncbi:MAG: amidohydrolase family protein, partial [Anaerolineae bacterium]|nr:amidohydrolase family protein [Anaerolineae bacterium]
QHIHTMDPQALTAEGALEMATIAGAAAVDRPDALGSLEVGKKADIVLVDLYKLHATPQFDPISNLVYAAQGSDVRTVVIDGRVVMEDRQILVADEEEILAEAETRGQDLLARTGVQVTPNWPVE